MARLPFPEPDDASPPHRRRAAAPPRAAAAAPAPLSVSQLSELIKLTLADHIPSGLRVVGEISNLSQRAHWFFSLKDAGSQLRCVCFASTARRLNIAIRDGQQVIVTGRLDYYDAQGHLQLYVDRIEPLGLGTLEQQFRALCNELRELGYFEPERKRPLPVMAQRIAVVTSRSAAALQDVINTTRRRWPGCQLFLYDVRVQGERAAGEIAAALDQLSTHGARLGIDAIILTRGGGSIEDLWAFNERVVAEAVYRCRLPIVAAIGHETDTTIAELVADHRCATPTQAAMTLVPDRAALEHQLHQLRQRLALVLRRQAQAGRQQLEAVARHPFFRRPEQLLRHRRQSLERAQQQLAAALSQRCVGARQRLALLQQRFAPLLNQTLRHRRQRLDALQRQLHAIGPRQVLQRGYSYTLGADGKLLRHAGDAQPGMTIQTVLVDGRVTSVVQGEDAGKPAPAQGSPSTPRSARSPRQRVERDAGQGQLF